MPVAAVLGWPLRHTRSPALHEAAYRSAGLSGWTYEARPTPPDQLRAAMDAVRSGELAGVNLTTPHKQAALEFVDRLEPPANVVGAVNTVTMREGALVGWNTDVAGALWALGNQLGLRDERWDGSRPVVLLGTGGMAAALAFAWARVADARRRQLLPAPSLIVAGRDRTGAKAVVRLAGDGATAAGWDEVPDLLSQAGVVLHATTLTELPGLERLAAEVRMLDCNYGPAAEALAGRALEAGAAVAADGLGLLIAQAAAAVVKIARVRPDLPAMAAAVGFPWPVGGVPG